MKKTKMDRKDCIILFFILLTAFLFRLYKIDTPLADLHSWRQVDTASVARNFTREGVNLIRPTYDDLSGREAGKENPQGLRMVEFPIYNALTALSYKFAPSLAVEVHARFISALFSLIIIAILYYLLLRESGRISAIIAGLVYAIFPFFVFFSRVVLPETTAVSFGLMSIFFLYLFTYNAGDKARKFIFFPLSIFFFALSLLVKPTAIFYGFVLAYLFIAKNELSSFKRLHIYIFFILSALPLVLWRFYIQRFPEGIPASDWLITSVNTYEGLKVIFLKPAFFRWIFFERINNLILGGYLSVLFIVGIFKKNSRFFFLSFLMSSILYLLIFEGGNVQHEYYQTIILPTIAIFIGLGTELLWSLRKNFVNNYVLIATMGVIFISSFFFSYYKVAEYYNYPNDLTTIARIIKTLTKPDDKIVTDRLGDTTLLYLSDRKGWPAYSGNLDELKSKGYKYFVTANKDLITEINGKGDYIQIFQNNNFTIFAL